MWKEKGKKWGKRGKSERKRNKVSLPQENWENFPFPKANWKNGNSAAIPVNWDIWGGGARPGSRGSPDSGCDSWALSPSPDRSLYRKLSLHPTRPQFPAKPGKLWIRDFPVRNFPIGKPLQISFFPISRYSLWNIWEHFAQNPGGFWRWKR